MFSELHRIIAGDNHTLSGSFLCKVMGSDAWRGGDRIN